MKKIICPIAVVALLMLAGCTVTTESVTNNSVNSNNKGTSTITNSSVNNSAKASTNNESKVAASSFSSISAIDYSSFSITSTSGGEISQADNNYIITSAGEYDISGSITEGYIYVNAGEEDDVVLNLNNVSISCSTNSPIYILSANEVEIKSAKGYENTIIDNRAHKVEDDDTQGNGAIYSKCDLKLTGKGKLSVKGNYNNGVHSTKDLKIKNNTLVVEAYNNALKGNDSVKIESGDLLLISTGGNGIITEDSDISSKGNQRGNVDIVGGKINIYSCKDAIDASYNINIGADLSQADAAEPEINIYTSNYSSYSGEVVSSTEGEYYLKTTSQLSSSYRLSVYYRDTDQNFAWADATFDKSVQEQGNRPQNSKTYYYYKFNIPSNAESLTVYCFNSGAENSTTEYICKSTTYSVNTNYDTLVISVTSSTISVSGWTTFSTTTTQQGGPGGGGMGPGGGGMGPGQEGNTNKASYSAKGIKADNIVNISNGDIYIKAYDDAIHANYGSTLENESTGLGDVNISGGNIEIYASDDGVHADRYLNITGGTINIVSSYEGIEANVISFSGGDTLVYATDDGVNAANKAGLSPAINVSGGKLDITVASGDTDGIDSNGSFTQTGGVVVTRGSGSNMSTGLDCDGQASITGGTFLSFGRTEATLKCGSNIKTQTLSGTFSAKTYTFKCGDFSITTTNKMSYNTVYIYSDVGNNFTY